MRTLIPTLLTVVFGLGIAPMTHAQSGGIDASPAPVIIPSGSTAGSTDVFWAVSGGEAFYITVNCGGDDALFASSGAGSYSQSAPWITVGASCVFSLRAHAPSGPVLGSVTVNGVAPNGAISASPETVVIPVGQSHGNTNIGWVGEHADSFHVTANCGGGDVLFASSGPGSNSQGAPWIGVGATCVFSLHTDSASGPVLDSVTVTGVAVQAPSGSISASPTTVNISAGQSSGSTTLSWVGQDATSFVVTRDCGSGESVFTSSSAGSYSQVASGITAGANCAFRLRADNATGPVLGSVTVTGIATQIATGTLIAAPPTVIIPPGQSVGTSTLDWTAQGGTSFHVTASCGGSAEQLFASSGAGSYSQSAPWITVGANCTFRLRTETTTGAILASANVTGVAGQAPTGSIAASPTTVNIPSGQSTGSSTISWNTTGVTQAHVRSSCAGVAQASFAVTGPGSFSQVANFIPVGASCTFQLSADSAAGPQLGSVTVIGQQTQTLITTQRGGSNHLFYRNPVPGSGDHAYNYGIMLHYHENGVRDTVRGQLQQMYANGQRSLRVLVHYLHAPGEVITSTPAESSRKCLASSKECPPGGEYFLPQQYQQNLRDYLADVRIAGFERVMLALGPQWINDFGSCNSTDIPLSLRQQLYAGSPLVNELFEEAWGVAKEVRAIAVGSGMPYLIDLGNEYIPPSNLIDFGQCAKDIIEGTSQHQGYLRFLWGRYVAAYGTQDTVGFSVIVGNSWDADNRLARMPLFLSPLPLVYSLHSYTSSGDITGGLNRAYQVTGSFGRRPWIIGETDNRSTVSADAIRNFIVNRPEQQVLHVMQWPGFNCTTEAECLPLDFSAFSSRGF